MLKKSSFFLGFYCRPFSLNPINPKPVELRTPSYSDIHGRLGEGSADPPCPLVRRHEDPELGVQSSRFRGFTPTPKLKPGNKFDEGVELVESSCLRKFQTTRPKQDYLRVVW